MRLYRLELERSLRRRIVWVLVAIALLGIALMGLVAFLDSADLDLGELSRTGQTHPAVLRHWWITGGGDGTLIVGAIFLLMGGLIGGAGVVGGEWRSGSIATTLTWEPRRTRLLVVRLTAMATCAFVIAVLLQAALMIGLLPSVVLHGTTDGADGAYVLVLIAAVVRIAALSALAAVLAGCLASISRSTAGAIIGVWVWLALVEAILRARKPWTGAYLLAENVASVVEWARPEATSGRAPLGAAALLVLYTVALAALAAQVFRRADVIAG